MDQFISEFFLFQILLYERYHLQFSEGIGHELIEFAIKEFGADHLLVLEKNVKAI